MGSSSADVSILLQELSLSVCPICDKRPVKGPHTAAVEVDPGVE